MNLLEVVVVRSRQYGDLARGVTLVQVKVDINPNFLGEKNKTGHDLQKNKQTPSEQLVVLTHLHGDLLWKLNIHSMGSQAIRPTKQGTRQGGEQPVRTPRRRKKKLSLPVGFHSAIGELVNPKSLLER